VFSIYVRIDFIGLFGCAFSIFVLVEIVQLFALAVIAHS